MDDVEYPGKTKLVLRMDPERAAFSMAKSTKMRIMQALQAQRMES